MFRLTKLLLVFFLTLGLWLSAVTVLADTKPRLVPQEIYFDQVMAMLDRAEKTGEDIDLMQFIMASDEGFSRHLAARIREIKKKKPDIRIRIALEGKVDADDPTGASSVNRRTVEFFSGSGVQFYLIQGVAAEQTATGVAGLAHAKGIRVGNLLLLGSNNMSENSVTPYHNNEVNLLFESRLLADAFESYFDKVISDPSQLYPLAASDGTFITYTDGKSYNRILETIQRAQAGDELIISMFFFALRNEKDSLVRVIYDEIMAAHNRGVNVKVLLDQNDKTGRGAEVSRVNREVAAMFLDDGLRGIYLDLSEKTTHSKVVLLNGPGRKSFLNLSTNFLVSDISYNHQMDLEVTDATLVDQLRNYLLQKFAYEATVQGPQPLPKMFRIWRGFKQDGVSDETLREKVNELLIPATSDVGAQRGLLAYLPALIKPETRPPFLPDEIAIIAYGNEDLYNAIRTTPDGLKYGPLHFKDGLFARQNSLGFASSSVVAENITAGLDSLKLGQAYFFGKDIDWQSGNTYLRVLIRDQSSPNDATYLSDTHLRLLGYQTYPSFRAGIVLIDAKYQLEFLNYETRPLDPTYVLAQTTSYLKVFQVSLFDRQVAGNTHLNAASGINVQFPTKLKSPDQLIQAVLEPATEWKDNELPKPSWGLLSRFRESLCRLLEKF